MNINTQPFSYEYKGNLTSQKAYELKNVLSKIVNQGNTNLSIILSEVDEADVVGVNALVMTHKLVGQFDGKIEVILKKDSHLDSLIHLTKFSHIFTIIYSK